VDNPYDGASASVTDVKQDLSSTETDPVAKLLGAHGTGQADLAKTPMRSNESISQKPTKRAPSGQLPRPRGRRMPHNLIEKRYRNNLNHQIEVLRDELPAFKSIVACTTDIEDTASLGGKWPSKAILIAAAVQYIGLLEQQRGHAMSRNALLYEQVAGLQEMVRCDDCAIVQYLEGMQPQILAA